MNSETLNFSATGAERIAQQCEKIDKSFKGVEKSYSGLKKVTSTGIPAIKAGSLANASSLSQASNISNLASLAGMVAIGKGFVRLFRNVNSDVPKVYSYYTNKFSEQLLSNYKNAKVASKELSKGVLDLVKNSDVVLKDFYGSSISGFKKLRSKFNEVVLKEAPIKRMVTGEVALELFTKKLALEKIKEKIGASFSTKNTFKKLAKNLVTMSLMSGNLAVIAAGAVAGMLVIGLTLDRRAQKIATNLAKGIEEGANKLSVKLFGNKLIPLGEELFESFKSGLQEYSKGFFQTKSLNIDQQDLNLALLGGPREQKRYADQQRFLTFVRSGQDNSYTDARIEEIKRLIEEQNSLYNTQIDSIIEAQKWNSRK